MTDAEIIAIIEETLKQKITQNADFIRYSFFEVNVKYGFSEDDKTRFMIFIRNKLENMNYKIYTEGEKYSYNNSNMVVQINESIIAIRNKKEDVNNGTI